MKYDPKEFTKYPEIMSKEQMRVVCHISKRTALYLLQSGLVPCEQTGKKTWCYRIKKKDVVAFYLDHAQNPERYFVPQDWYQNGDLKKPAHRIRVLPPPIPKEDMRRYYEQDLVGYPDVLDVAQVCAYTGYDRRAVGGWVRSGRLHTIMRTSKYYIPKRFLIDYLCSPEHGEIIRKSRKHVDTLWEAYTFSLTVS